MKRTATAFITCVLLFSCSSKNEVPKGILKQTKMQAVLWEVLEADAFAFQFVTKDSSKKPEAEMAALQQQIFAAHKTNRSEFYKSFEYYKSHPDVMLPFLDSMINKYTRDKFIHLKDTTQRVKPDSLKAL